MPRVRGREPADLDVVSHQVVRLRQGVRLPLKELFLGIPARAPGQHAADVQILAQDMPHHVGGTDPFGRAVVMGTPRCVNVMVSRVPEPLGRVNPPPQLDCQTLIDGVWFDDQWKRF